MSRFVCRLLFGMALLSALGASGEWVEGCDQTSAGTKAGGTADLTGTWEIRWRCAIWASRNIRGVLRFERASTGWAGSARIDDIYAGRATFAISAASISGDAAAFVLRAPDGTEFHATGTLTGDAMEGAITWTDASGHPQTDAFHADRYSVAWMDGQHDGTDARLPVAADPRTTGLDPVLLDQLVLAAQEANTDALVVLSDGQIVCERYFGRKRSPMSVASVTKAVANLALGLLFDEGKLASLDTPLSHWFPEFAAADRAGITLRHLLTHTTGLTPESIPDLNVAPDQLAYARAATRVEAPGVHFTYNNRAMELVSGIVRTEAGQEVEAYLRERVFGPLGITHYTWFADRAGHTATYAGLNIDALDLAILGQMLADGGRWQGKQVVSERWVQMIQVPGVDVAPLVGLTWFLQRDHSAEDKPVIGFGHSGDGGQYLYIYPSAHLVGVRFAARKGRVASEGGETSDPDGFDAFGSLMNRMAMAKLKAAKR